jgi:hypothetical protein
MPLPLPPPKTPGATHIEIRHMHEGYYNNLAFYVPAENHAFIGKVLGEMYLRCKEYPFTCTLAGCVVDLNSDVYVIKTLPELRTYFSDILNVAAVTTQEGPFVITRPKPDGEREAYPRGFATREAAEEHVKTFPPGEYTVVDSREDGYAGPKTKH